MARAIRFYAVNDAYGELSNFAAFPIEVDGKVWPTSEHYFQAQKFRGTSHEEAVRRAPDPSAAARAGRSRERPLRADWAHVKESVMLTALRAKFTQHPQLRALLLQTDAAELVEHTENDRYWGDGGDGRGRNRLGRLLMQVRGELRDARPEGGAPPLAAIWRAILPDPGKAFALFENGTCVVLAEPGGDPWARARALLAEHGPVHPGSSAADFSVKALETMTGWVVSFDHPDLLVYVAPSEVEGGGDSEVLVGLIGRAKREADVEGLRIIHVEAGSATT
jgi:ribA/ribD-fused uncharacterized protein